MAGRKDNVCRSLGHDKSRQSACDPISAIANLIYFRRMRHVPSLAILALVTVGCADRNLLGEDIWSDERLARAEVSLGWNYVVNNKIAPSRNVDILIRRDNSYQIEIIEYRFEAPPVTLDRVDGELSPIDAARLRRNLAALRSDDAQDLFTSMPGCPEWSHPAIEYYVGFTIDEKAALTVLEAHCETSETVEGRRVISEAMAHFPQVKRTKLLAGLEEF